MGGGPSWPPSAGGWWVSPSLGLRLVGLQIKVFYPHIYGSWRGGRALRSHPPALLLPSPFPPYTP